MSSSSPLGSRLLRRPQHTYLLACQLDELKKAKWTRGGKEMGGDVGAWVRHRTGNLLMHMEAACSGDADDSHKLWWATQPAQGPTNRLSQRPLCSQGANNAASEMLEDDVSLGHIFWANACPLVKLLDLPLLNPGAHHQRALNQYPPKQTATACRSWEVFWYGYLIFLALVGELLERVGVHPALQWLWVAEGPTSMQHESWELSSEPADSSAELMNRCRKDTVAGADGFGTSPCSYTSDGGPHTDGSKMRLHLSVRKENNLKGGWVLTVGCAEDWPVPLHTSVQSTLGSNTAGCTLDPTKEYNALVERYQALLRVQAGAQLQGASAIHLVAEFIDDVGMSFSHQLLSLLTTHGAGPHWLSAKNFTCRVQDLVVPAMQGCMNSLWSLTTSRSTRRKQEDGGSLRQAVSSLIASCTKLVRVWEELGWLMADPWTSEGHWGPTTQMGHKMTRCHEREQEDPPSHQVMVCIPWDSSRSAVALTPGDHEAGPGKPLTMPLRSSDLVTSNASRSVPRAPSATWDPSRVTPSLSGSTPTMRTQLEGRRLVHPSSFKGPSSPPASKNSAGSSLSGNRVSSRGLGRSVSLLTRKVLGMQPSQVQPVGPCEVTEVWDTPRDSFETPEEVGALAVVTLPTTRPAPSPFALAPVDRTNLERLRAIVLDLKAIQQQLQTESKNGAEQGKQMGEEQLVDLVDAGEDG